MLLLCGASLSLDAQRIIKKLIEVFPPGLGRVVIAKQNSIHGLYLHKLPGFLVVVLACVARALNFSMNK